jgi:Uma2 family endonuclease
MASTNLYGDPGELVKVPAFADPAEQRMVLNDITWETYERLLHDNLDRRVPRFTYDQGVLEIMSPSAEHEWYNQLLSDLVKMLARELRIDILSLGSTTFKSASVRQGFEPDSCFYVSRVQQIRVKRRVDMTLDPPPDIVVEVAVTHPAVNKFPICAEMRIPEIWVYDGNRLVMYHIDDAEYRETPSTHILGGLEAKLLGDFLELGKSLDNLAWPDEVLKRFRQSR